MGLKLNVYLKKNYLGRGSLENAKKYIVNNTLVCNGGHTLTIIFKD